MACPSLSLFPLLHKHTHTFNNLVGAINKRGTTAVVLQTSCAHKTRGDIGNTSSRRGIIWSLPALTVDAKKNTKPSVCAIYTQRLKNSIAGQKTRPCRTCVRRGEGVEAGGWGGGSAVRIQYNRGAAIRCLLPAGDKAKETRKHLLSSLRHLLL